MAKNSQAVIPDNIIVVEGDGLNPVPTPEAGDAGKVLGVLNSSGDIGWVEDQGGTLTQVQSDWAETDSSKVSYIDNKPDLSVYATTSAVNTALASKQDTISDLSEIRAGAAKGDTAVQPATLDDYATTSAMNTALAGKQDTISDLATIRAGAALGATAAQPSDLPSSDELLPSASSGDAGKVLTVDSQGEPQWVTPSGGATYSAGDGIAIDGNNVISADVDGVTIGIDSTTKKIKSLQTIPTVDQTYSASSTHAQSGTAVAQAIAAIPSSSYTAGDGIKISSNEISADFEVVQPCLTFGSDFKFDGATQYRATLSNNTLVSVPYNTACKFTLPGNLPSTVQTGMNGGTLKLQIVDSNSTVIQTLKSKYYPDSYLNIPIPQDFYKDVDIPAISVNNCYLRWAWSTTSLTKLTVSNFDSTAYCFVVPYSGTLALANPVTVDQTYSASSTNAQSGAAVAQAIASIPSSSYTAGDGIDITSGEISVNADDATLDFNPVTVQSTSSSSNWDYDSVAATTDVKNALNSQTPVEVKIHLPARAVHWDNNLPSTATFRIAVTSNHGAYSYVYDGATVEMYEVGGYAYMNEAQDITVIGPATSWSISGGSGSWTGITGIMIAVVSGGSIYGYCEELNGGEVTYTVTRTDPNKTMLAVKNPLPASAQADSGKVLKVNASGNAEWGPDGFTTTAGITDIQQVAALPANPVATVLYLIPET